MRIVQLVALHKVRYPPPRKASADTVMHPPPREASADTVWYPASGIEYPASPR